MKRIYIILLAAIAGCSKGYLDVNQTNPNQTTNPPINGLLSEVTYQTGVNVFNVGNITSYYVQQLASPNASSSTDVYDDIDASTTWKNIYLTIEDIRQMEVLAVEKNAYQHMGVGQILEAYNMSMLIDLWGDAPYSQAWQGATYLTPAYDKGAAIYDSCLLLIEKGIASLKQADPLITLDAENDLVHSGSVAGWIKTAYTLKARLLNRLSKQADYDPAAILSALDSGYTSNSDDAAITRFESLSLWNGVAVNNASGNLDGWLSATFINALNGSTYGIFDPRLPLITDTTKYGDYRGTVNGAGRVGSGTDKGQCYLSVNGYYSKSGAPLLLLTYAEARFIAAEAYFNTDAAKSYQAYLDGIGANMDKVGVSVTDKANYLSQLPAYSKELLFKEKYVVMFLQPECWTDARRYDYQYKNFNLPANALLTTFIRRVSYPASETSRNAANVPAVSSLADVLWWDK
ncbi:SusD/RagB family nutrient-binding outer membrane lipoprotein [Chitinophaga sp. LS1]|uniref:SusD/RagB family nutrient-binding outer membrane lipoprotein n=1 Tax=Chitinophaga sp. LS1 TaxID=3051176 RepID=UPI002AAB4F64|nr:SusD/RagB family nutrient-binding outer membrane lipoprotein [Chitinophaga sp. LS1]WPV64899.1 SusD/RagB family nutrient-binding outer membrane lipoprotein [Chitinophaga sp. LS1]